MIFQTVTSCNLSPATLSWASMYLRRAMAEREGKTEEQNAINRMLDQSWVERVTKNKERGYENNDKSTVWR